MQVLRLFVACQPGLEGLLKEELSTLGIDGKVEPGGAEVKTDLLGLYKLNLHLRVASRVLLRLAEFRAKHPAEFLRKASKVNWEDFLDPKEPLKIRVSSRKSKLYHTGAVKQRLLRAIEKRCSFSPKETEFEDFGQSIVVRIKNDVCTLSINSSGALLHKRGYRKKSVKAPIRETIAAAMIKWSGWEAEDVLIDPFCGSGTIPIEAALIQSNKAPGLIRKEFAFMRWKNFDKNLWDFLLKEAQKGMKKAAEKKILGFDIDKKAIDASVENAKAADVKSVIFKRASLPRLKFSKVFVVTNPPYGRRLSADLKLYLNFGRWLESFDEFVCVFACPSRKLASAVGKAELVETLDNGGVKVGIWKVEKGRSAAR